MTTLGRHFSLSPVFVKVMLEQTPLQKKNFFSIDTIHIYVLYML